MSDLKEAFETLCPVGMIAHAGSAGEQLARLAAEKMKNPKWQAFHYEKLDNGDYEVTGGIAVESQGQIKFELPHDSVIVSASHILDELTKISTSSLAQPTSTKQSASKAFSDTGENRLWVNLRILLPDNPDERIACLQAYCLGNDLHGGTIVASSLEADAKNNRIHS